MPASVSKWRHDAMLGRIRVGEGSREEGSRMCEAVRRRGARKGDIDG